MLSPNKTRESLAGKLLLSSALVAVSLAYGWWQRPSAERPVMAMAPRAPGKVAPQVPAAALPAPAAPETQDADVASGVKDAPVQAAIAPPKSAAIATAEPQANTPAAAPVAPPDADASAPPPAPTAPTAQQAMQMNLPTDAASPALPWVTGNPDPGAVAAVPAGSHLADGEYLSNKHELMWGDVKVKIAIHGGQITAVQVLDFPDHRSQSLYLSQMALPILESEVIKGQKSQVDTVSSATDTSYTFQDAIAEAITSATRG